MEKVEAPLAIFKMATDRLDDASIDYVVFGGIAVWGYGRRRWTRDIDLLVKKTDAKRVLAELDGAGFATEERDHRWLYKAVMDQAHIDLIFRAKGEVLSFLFLVEAFGADGDGDRVIPAPIIHQLIDVYLRGQSNSKRRYA